jgi:hypothetical protein
VVHQERWRQLGRSKVGEDPGWAGVGCAGQQASWAGARFLGLERKGGCSGLSWAKRPDGLDAMVGFAMKKNQEKEKG